MGWRGMDQKKEEGKDKERKGRGKGWEGRVKGKKVGMNEVIIF